MAIRVLARWTAAALLALCIVGCGQTLIPTDSGPIITTQPTAQTAVAGKTVTFSVVAVGLAPLVYQWFENGKAITGANSTSYTTPALFVTDNNSIFFVLITNSKGSAESNVVLLTVTASGTIQATPARPADVATLHNDPARTGQNLDETILTPGNVNPSTFGKIGMLPVDGAVDAQPLFLSNVPSAGKPAKNVLYIATEHDSVYAFDASTGAVLWRTRLAPSGETSSDNRSCNEAQQEIGVTATPVIDRTRGPNGAIYVLAASKDGAGNYFQRLHALDVATGAELFGGPTTIEATASNVGIAGTSPSLPSAKAVFDPASVRAQAGMILVSGQVIASWTPLCGSDSGNNWITAHDASTQTLTSALSFSSAGSVTGMPITGAGLSADAAGYLYIFNGASATNTASATNGSFGLGNGLLRISNSQTLAVDSYSSLAGASNNASQSSGQGDIGVLVLPDVTDASGKATHLAVSVGLNGHIYVINRDSLAGPSVPANALSQEIAGGLSLDASQSVPAYFNGIVYFGSEGDSIKAFPVSDAKLSSAPGSQTANLFTANGAALAISADHNSNGILWAIENGDSGVLHAYDAADLTRELYNSAMSPNSRDAFGPAARFVSPTIANGRVYVATQNGVAVFGPLQ